MKTAFEQIVNTESIGLAENSISQENLFSSASAEELQAAVNDEHKTLLLVVDMQRDFMDNGALGVKGATQDVVNLSHFIYDNMEDITAIAATCDCHTPMQIFHPCWWKDENGNEPAPFTIITKEEVVAGHWIPQLMPEKSIEYLEVLENESKKRLCIWPYHCLEETAGAALETQFLNMANFFSIARKASFRKYQKGQVPYSEFYGALYPEYRETGTENAALINYVKRFDKIIIAGEAMDYCVYETIKQLYEEFENSGKIPRIYLLGNCTSSIGPREQAEEQYVELIKNYGFAII